MFLCLYWCSKALDSNCPPSGWRQGQKLPEKELELSTQRHKGAKRGYAYEVNVAGNDYRKRADKKAAPPCEQGETAI